jgi:hypothetical protein
MGAPFMGGAEAMMRNFGHVAVSMTYGRGDHRKFATRHVKGNQPIARGCFVLKEIFGIVSTSMSAARAGPWQRCADLGLANLMSSMSRVETHHRGMSISIAKGGN